MLWGLDFKKRVSKVGWAWARNTGIAYRRSVCCS